MENELVEKLDFDLLYTKTINVVGRRPLNISEDLCNKTYEYFKPEKKEPVIEVEESKEEENSLLTEEDIEDIATYHITQRNIAVLFECRHARRCQFGQRCTQRYNRQTDNCIAHT